MPILRCMKTILKHPKYGFTRNKFSNKDQWEMDDILNWDWQFFGKKFYSETLITSVYIMKRRIHIYDIGSRTCNVFISLIFHLFIWVFDPTIINLNKGYNVAYAFWIRYVKSTRFSVTSDLTDVSTEPSFFYGECPLGPLTHRSIDLLYGCDRLCKKIP